MTVSFPLLRIVVATAALNVSFAQAASHHASSGVPEFDVKTSCRDAEKFGVQSQDKDIGFKGCLQDEQNAKDELKQRWSKFNGENKQSCVEQARAPSPSYVEVLTCLEMYTDGIKGSVKANPGVDSNATQPAISK